MQHDFMRSVPEDVKKNAPALIPLTSEVSDIDYLIPIAPVKGTIIY